MEFPAQLIGLGAAIAYAIANIAARRGLQHSTPMSVLIGTALWMRDIERINRRTTTGTLLTVAGIIVISVAG
jgi:drug/metabolite transporter (DMT)-like permease